MTINKFLEKISPSISAVSFDNKDRNRKIAEVQTMLENVENATFTNRSTASRLTGLSYLSGVNSSSKIAKGEKKEYNTVVLYLAAADMSGFNLCPMATDGCKNACLVSSGRARMVSEGKKINNITWSRLKKTWLFMFNREFFNSWLFAEISAYKNLANKNGKAFAVRLNGTSDLPIGMFKVGGVNVLETFTDVQFYDYTKLPKQLGNGAKYDNYDVTFSFANSDQHNNTANTLQALALGCKISVVFDLKTFPNNSFPETFLGANVVNGDETDLTFLQEEQVLGLNFKKTGADISANNFVLSYEEYKKLNLEVL